MPARPEIVYDGTDDLDRTVVPTSVRPCPSCRRPVEFDPVGVVIAGRSIGLATSEVVAHLQERALVSLAFTVGEFDGRRTLHGSDGCTPHVSRLRCPGCGRALFAVASYGEVQPARWRLVVDGLIDGDDP